MDSNKGLGACMYLVKATTDCIKSDLPIYMFKQAGQYNYYSPLEYWYVIFLYKVISSESHFLQVNKMHDIVG